MERPYKVRETSQQGAWYVTTSPWYVTTTTHGHSAPFVHRHMIRPMSCIFAFYCRAILFYNIFYDVHTRL